MTDNLLNIDVDAVHEWGKILGDDCLLNSELAGNRYGNCTSTGQRRIRGALIPQPRSEQDPYQEVREIVKVAAHFSIPLYPISTGHNWGYGTSNPAIDDCVVLDLSGFNRIKFFDEELGVITVEPGVTQAQLAKFLDEKECKYLVPTTGAGPTCSILGNALEHGYGITPITDHFASVTSIEAILADGSTYRSAHAELNSCDVDRVYKWGLGPYVDGLFTQNGFGIVTSMTIALAKKPKCISAFFFSVSNEKNLEDVVEGIRDIMQSLGGIVGSVNLMNQHRVLAMTVPYPREYVDENGLLSDEIVAELGRKNKIMAWTGVGALYGESSVIHAAEKIVRKKLSSSVNQLIFMSPGKIKFLNGIARLIPFKYGEYLRNILSKIGSSLDIMMGHPSEVALQLAYWKNTNIPPQSAQLNPSRDRCGLVWYSPLIPMKGDAVRRYVNHVSETCKLNAVEPLITLTAFSERCFGSSVPLLFNSNNESEVNNVHDCYNSLFEKGLELGFPPYRLGIHSMNKIDADSSAYWSTVKKIKSCIDPKDIISPGRYVPSIKSKI
jgi:4-cresol dehydrogenase (hydroxylating) flavoprotein subunit